MLGEKVLSCSVSSSRAAEADHSEVSFQLLLKKPTKEAERTRPACRAAVKIRSPREPTNGRL